MPNRDQVFSLADAACYAAKNEGRNRVHFWSPGDQVLEQQQGEMSWVSRIRKALEEDRFVLYAQPIVPTRSSEADGKVSYEVLVRMLDEKGGVVPPGQFLPVAERYQLASRIDRWVIGQVLRELDAHPNHLKRLDFCSINLSGLSLTNDTLQEELAELIGKYPHIRPECLCFEVTETAAITNLGRAVEFIRKMRAVGCRFALDDFGTGVSSFAYLKNLPVDFLKIDGVFVKDIVNDPIDRVVVEAIHNVGHEMGKVTVAEFVEDEAIRQTLALIGVDLCQGFGIARPVPLTSLLDSR
jgi:EAL domain-containing protein (putative c-di-GMP-specific phosphodiesterase class I)